MLPKAFLHFPHCMMALSQSSSLHGLVTCLAPGGAEPVAKSAGCAVQACHEINRAMNLQCSSTRQPVQHEVARQLTHWQCPAESHIIVTPKYCHSASRLGLSDTPLERRCDATAFAQAVWGRNLPHVRGSRFQLHRGCRTLCWIDTRSVGSTPGVGLVASCIHPAPYRLNSGQLFTRRW